MNISGHLETNFSFWSSKMKLEIYSFKTQCKLPLKLVTGVSSHQGAVMTWLKIHVWPVKVFSLWALKEAPLVLFWNKASQIKTKFSKIYKTISWCGSLTQLLSGIFFFFASACSCTDCLTSLLPFSSPCSWKHSHIHHAYVFLKFDLSFDSALEEQVIAGRWYLESRRKLIALPFQRNSEKTALCSFFL